MSSVLFKWYLTCKKYFRRQKEKTIYKKEPFFISKLKSCNSIGFGFLISFGIWKFLFWISCSVILFYEITFFEKGFLLEESNCKHVSELEDVVDTIKPSDNIDNFREVQQLKAKIRDQEIKKQAQGKTKQSFIMLFSW